MIHININLFNPWFRRWGNINYWAGSMPIPHKFWELQILKTNSLFGFELNITHCSDHAGINIGVSFLGFEINFNLYDHRHWDHDQNKWSE